MSMVRPRKVKITLPLALLFRLLQWVVVSREELLRGPKGLSTCGVGGFSGEQTGSQGSLVLESGRWARARHIELLEIWLLDLSVFTIGGGVGAEMERCAY